MVKFSGPLGTRSAEDNQGSAKVPKRETIFSEPMRGLECNLTLGQSATALTGIYFRHPTSPQ